MLGSERNSCSFDGICRHGPASFGQVGRDVAALQNLQCKDPLTSRLAYSAFRRFQNEDKSDLAKLTRHASLRDCNVCTTAPAALRAIA